MRRTATDAACDEAEVLSSLLGTVRNLFPRRSLTQPETTLIAERMALRVRAQLDQIHPALDETELARLPWIAGIEEADGLPKSGMASCLPNGLWVITINAREPKVRRRFSLAHELCHTIVDEAGNVLFSKTRFAAHEQRLERFCDRFAAALLMPKIMLRSDWVGGMQSVPRLARRYRVSTTAMTVRLNQLGLLEPVAKGTGVSTKEEVA